MSFDTNQLAGGYDTSLDPLISEQDSLLTDLGRYESLLSQFSPQGRIASIVDDIGMRLSRVPLPPTLVTSSNPTTAHLSEKLARMSVAQLKQFFLNGIHVQPYIDIEMTTPVYGFGIMDSIRCLDDFVRTYKFITALQAHISDMSIKRDGQITMIDAGCGAIPLYGIIAAYWNSRIKVTCLEINEMSAKLAQDIILRHGLQDRVDVVLADATRYQPSEPVDILISETMNAGLTGNEYLTKIFANLSPHVREDGAIIPEWVTVEAALIPMRDDAGNSDSLRYLTHLPLTGRTSTPSLYPTVTGNFETIAKVDPRRPPSIINRYFPIEHLPPGRYSLALGSQVGLHHGAGVTLDRYESYITTPLRLKPIYTLGQTRHNPVGFALQYEPGSLAPNIGVRWQY